MKLVQTFRREWLTNIPTEILSALLVALALIPEAIGFSIVAGVDPKVGLYASFSIACVTAIVGGRPAMISAATASTAVLMTTLVRDHGLQYLFAATVLMGIIQLIAGALRLGLLMKFVSRSVMTGFVNALAILIFMAQLPQLMHVGWPTYAMVAAGLAIIYLFPMLTKIVPSALVSIIVLTAFAIFSGLKPQFFDQIDVASWRRVLEVNVIGVFLCCRAALPAFKRRDGGRLQGAAQRRGPAGPAGGLEHPLRPAHRGPAGHAQFDAAGG